MVSAQCSVQLTYTYVCLVYEGRTTGPGLCNTVKTYLAFPLAITLGVQFQTHNPEEYVRERNHYKKTCQFLVVTMKLRRQLLLLIAVLLSLLCAAQCISFSLDPDVRKCIQEEVHKDVLVVGEYKLSDQDGQKTDILVCLCEYVCG